MISSEQTMKPLQSTVSAKAVTEPGRYPTYKAARVHWLGEIPAHWQEKRGKYFFREVDERSATGEEELLSVSHTTGVTPRSQKNVTMFKAESYVGHKVARPNDVVINTMWAWMSALGVSKNVGIVSPAYGVYRPINGDDFLPEFVGYLLRTPLLKWEYICRSTGIRSSRLRLYPDKFLDIAFPCPPAAEQERMVSFLRAKEVQIRRLIRNKRRLIGLLNEQKQAIINQAVTRGLNPNAPMKPTGIDWMPEVPVHWEVKPLKHWLRESAKALGDKTDPDYSFDYLDISCVGTGYLTAKPERLRFENAPSRARQIVQKGDTLISTVRTYLKAVYFVEDEWPDLIASTGFAVLRPVSEIEPKLLGMILQSSTFIERVIRSSIGVAYPAISETKLGTLHVAIPLDREEQNLLLNAVQDETGALNAAIEKAQSEIALIGEYRERLIADIVTGKLDVRHVDIVVPIDEAEIDEAEELDADDELTNDDMMEGADADD
ncbi:restriction endonuclease subunit S [Thalassospira alkalitolerans]|uniref:restriction endonuclease subunit S n=1 Tax=Thalassospira alkalitolerans TaxID=1293890 RepID=UPI0030EB96A0|tara:strand:- start:48209 stop:49678 length:1470 start_codon:yes stop_codon:yes gene_type:complete